MLFLPVAAPVDTLYDVLATFYSHQHPQYTLVDISACCAVRIATLGDVTTARYRYSSNFSTMWVLHYAQQTGLDVHACQSSITCRYKDDHLSYEDIQKLIQRFGNQTLDFFGAIRAGTYDSQILCAPSRCCTSTADKISVPPACVCWVSVAHLSGM